MLNGTHDIRQQTLVYSYFNGVYKLNGTHDGYPKYTGKYSYAACIVAIGLILVVSTLFPILNTKYITHQPQSKIRLTVQSFRQQSGQRSCTVR